MTARPVALLLFGSCVALILGGCSGQPATRAGADSTSRALTAAAYFPGGYPSGDTLDQLASHVAANSSGSIRIAEGPSPYTQTNKDPGSQLLNMVMDGTIDLAVVPARVFDVEGVSSLDALQAPFVFTSTEQADALLGDPVAASMLAPLDAIGVKGLALTYDALRNAVGYQRPLVSPSDFAGQAFAFRPNTVTRAAVTALGAHEYAEVGATFERAIADETVAGLEDSINQPNRQGIGWSVGNEFLSFKANVIVVNAQVWDGLDDRQRESLQAAAEVAREWSYTAMPWHLDLAAAAREFCESGAGDVVVASDTEVAAMRAAVAPVIDKLRSDPLTASVLDRITQLEGEVSATAAESCQRVPSGDSGWRPVVADGDQHVVDGVWRIEVDAERLLAAGASPSDASNNESIWTWTINGSVVRARSVKGDDCVAALTRRGDRLSILWDEATDCGINFTARFRVDTHVLSLDRAVADELGAAALYDAFFAPGFTRV